jgi:murein DD-endopeptidase MepM/ murein hydrolase activator NlpD
MSAWTFVRRPNDHPLVAKDPTPTQWAATVLQQLGIPQSPGAVQALTGWARAEGGHWNNQARFNPLNTTQPEPGYTKTGAQGNIGSYTSWQQGVDATVKTLTNGRYAPILSALKAGDANRVGQAIGQTPWGTNGGLVQRVIAGTPAVQGAQPFDIGAGTSAAPPPSNAVSALTSSSPSPSQGSPGAALALQLASSRRQAPQGSALQAPAVTAGPVISDAYKALGATRGPAARPDVSALISAAATIGQATPPSPTADSSAPLPAAPGPGDGQTTAAGVSPHAKPGDPVVSGKQSVGGEHATSGLAGYPAHDFFAPAGSHAVAPVSGTVVKLSGHDPANGPTNGPHGPLGWSAYIKGDDGRTYFLTHMGSRNLKVGETVKQGQIIGTVADYDKYGTPSHIHMGVSG